MKTCSKCGEYKSLDDYHHQPAGKMGRRADCKACVSKHMKKRNADPAEKARKAEYAARYYRENAELTKEYARKYYRRTPSVWWEFGYRQRCKRYGHQPKITKFTLAELLARWGDTCVDCGGEWEELDHIVPVWHGGEHSLDNCQPVCSACNIARWLKQTAERGFIYGPRLSDSA